MKEQSKKTHFHEFSQEINSVFFDFDQKNMSPVGAMELKSFHEKSIWNTDATQIREAYFGDLQKNNGEKNKERFLRETGKLKICF